MGNFRKKPVVIQAVQLRWDNWSEICDFADVGSLQDGKPQGVYLDADGNVLEPPDTGDELPGALVMAKMDSLGAHLGLAIPTLEGLMVGSENDWIIRGVQGELYPCKPDIFEATYEAVGE